MRSLPAPLTDPNHTISGVCINMREVAHLAYWMFALGAQLLALGWYISGETELLVGGARARFAVCTLGLSFSSDSSQIISKVYVGKREMTHLVYWSFALCAGLGTGGRGFNGFD